MENVKSSDNQKRLLSDLEVEREYGWPTATVLKRWRLRSERGPRWRKLGHTVRYERADIEAWIAKAPGGGGN